MEEGQVPEAQIRLFNLNMRVDVTVRLLSGGDPGDQIVDHPLELGIRMVSEHVGSAFNPFIDVRIRPPRPAEFPGGLLGRNVEILDATRRLELLVHVVERLGAIHLEPRRPEFVFNRDLLEWNLGKPDCVLCVLCLRRFCCAGQMRTGDPQASQGRDSDDPPIPSRSGAG